MSKNKNFRVNQSLSFMVRARCKHCLSGPINYWRVRNDLLIKDVNIANSRSHSIYTKSSTFQINEYLSSQMTNTYILRHSVYSKSYNPKLHKVKFHTAYPTIDVISCTCGRTYWNFDGSSGAYRPEIFAKMARSRYPTRFKY